MEWLGPGSRVLLLEKQGLDSRLKVIAKSGSAPELPAPTAPSSRSGGNWSGELLWPGENCPSVVRIVPAWWHPSRTHRIEENFLSPALPAAT